MNDMLAAVLTRNRIAIGIILAACLCLLGTYLLIMKSKHATTPPSPAAPEAVSKGESLPTTVEVADTAAKRTQGLSGRASIADDYGLLFVFTEDGRHGFWMKDMQFAIDIIWIAADGTVVHIEQALAPDTYPTVFTPTYPARYALETRAGYARDHGWKVGTVIDLSQYAERE